MCLQVRWDVCATVVVLPSAPPLVPPPLVPLLLLSQPRITCFPHTEA